LHNSRGDTPLAIMANILKKCVDNMTKPRMANGVSPLLLCKALGYMLPDVLRYALPLSMLVASVLVFSRMSADNEIVALKASGISLWQIMAPAILLASVLCAINFLACFYIGPEMRFRSWRLQWEVLSGSPLQLVESNTVTRLSPTMSIRVGGKDDKGVLRDIHLYEVDNHGQALRNITAKYGSMRFSQEHQTIELLLNDFTITELAIASESRERQMKRGTPNFLTAKTITIPIDYQSHVDKKGLQRKNQMMSLDMLIGELLNPEIQPGKRTKVWLEFHTRLALVLSPLAFMLLGIPFGITNRRSESSSGLIICVILSLGFYSCMVLAESLGKYLGTYAALIVWLPNIAYEISGLAALSRLSRH